jgi:hypothetical protein
LRIQRKQTGAESNVLNVTREILRIQTPTESLQRSSQKMSGSICYHIENTRYIKSILKGSDDGVQHTELLIFFWTFPSSGILETRKHDVSETGSVSVLR